jgi:hypothetical protein
MALAVSSWPCYAAWLVALLIAHPLSEGRRDSTVDLLDVVLHTDKINDAVGAQHGSPMAKPASAASAAITHDTQESHETAYFGASDHPRRNSMVELEHVSHANSTGSPCTDPGIVCNPCPKTHVDECGNCPVNQCSNCWTFERKVKGVLDSKTHMLAGWFATDSDGSSRRFEMVPVECILSSSRKTCISAKESGTDEGKVILCDDKIEIAESKKTSKLTFADEAGGQLSHVKMIPNRQEMKEREQRERELETHEAVPLRQKRNAYVQTDADLIQICRVGLEEGTDASGEFLKTLCKCTYVSECRAMLSSKSVLEAVNNLCEI